MKHFREEEENRRWWVGVPCKSSFACSLLAVQTWHLKKSLSSRKEVHAVRSRSGRSKQSPPQWWFQLTCIEFPDVLLVLKQRLQLRRQAMELQTVLEPALCNGSVTEAVGVRPPILMQADELENRWHFQQKAEQSQVLRDSRVITPAVCHWMLLSVYPDLLTLQGSSTAAAT